MKKGFTLIELLAVIIILAVVALIATPIVLDVVKDTKESAAKSQAYMILDGAKLYYTESMFDNTKKAKLTGVANIYDEISMNGKKPDNGKLYINKTGLVAMAVLINNKCYKKEFAGELQITEDQECDAGIANDSVIPTISLELNSKQGTVFNENGWANKDIWVDFNVTDNESGAYSYTWCSDNKECDPTNEPTEKVSGSFQVMYESETSYACAYGYDLAGNKSERVCAGPYKIDKQAPTITAVNEEVSINQGDNNLVSSYFTPSYSISGGTLSCSPVNTSALEQGSQTVTCTVTGGNGLQTTLTKNIIVKDIAFIKTYGGSKNDYMTSIIKTSDGGYIGIGFSESSSGDIPKNNGGLDILIMKLDGKGNKEWIKTYGGSQTDAVSSIIATNDGNYLIVGGSESNNGDITAGNKGSRDALIMKINPSGNIMWQKTYGGSGFDWINSVVQTTDGGYVLIGDSESNDKDITAGNKGSKDVLLMKISASGNLEWHKTYGGSGSDSGYSIIQTSDSGYMLVGNTTSSNGDITTGNKGNRDILIIKTNSTGTIEWIKTYGGSGIDYVNSMLQTLDGGYMLAGNTTSSNGDIPENKGGADILLMKITNAGNLEWVKTYGGSGNDSNHDSLNNIVQNSDGSYMLAGYTLSSDGDVPENKGIHDIIVIKTNNTGEMLWVKTYGGSQTEFFQSLLKIKDGSYILTGYTNSSDGDIKQNKGLYDILIIKFNE